jgi:hypothetical protein
MRKQNDVGRFTGFNASHDHGATIKGEDEAVSGGAFESRRELYEHLSHTDGR